jgi:hypothetical protein
MSPRLPGRAVEKDSRMETLQRRGEALSDPGRSLGEGR